MQKQPARYEAKQKYEPQNTKASKIDGK